MSIADKLTTIAENEQKVYKAGQDNFLHETMLNNGKRTWFSYMFRTCTNLVEAPYFDTSKGTQFSAMFYQCSKLKVVPQYDFSKGTAVNDLFVECTSLEELPEIIASNASNCNYMFHSCRNLRKIAKLNVSKHNVTSTIQSIFAGCTSLEEITFDGDIRQSIDMSACPLNVASAKSAIEALYVYKGTQYELARTISFNDDVWARLNAAEVPPSEATWQEYVMTVKGWST